MVKAMVIGRAANASGKLEEHLMSLRNATRAERQSTVPGVSWNKLTQMWQTRLALAGNKHFLGVFEEEADAAKAVEEARAAAVADNLEEHLKCLRMRKRRSKRQITVPGVCWHKQTQKWQVGLTLAGKKCFLGHFAEEAEAGKAVVAGRAAEASGKLEEHLASLWKATRSERQSGVPGELEQSDAEVADTPHPRWETALPREFRGGGRCSESSGGGQGG